MKIIEEDVSYLEQKPGVIGMLKHVETVGRLSHTSGDKTTEDSYIKFRNMIYESGHWAVFDLGTVYLSVPGKYARTVGDDKVFRLLNEPWTKFEINENGNYLITTTYRIIVRLGLDEFMCRYWCDPTENFYQRKTAFFTCSRATSHQLVRHASLRPNQESQRFNNYSRDKFNGEVTCILPQWVYDIREKYPEVKDLDGEVLWSRLCELNKTVKSRNNLWLNCEREYLDEIKDGMKPEDARGCLCEDTKTSLYMCGYLSDWYMKPEQDSKEKTGFFFLRSAPSAQRDVRVLSQKLEKIFEDNGFNKLK